MLAPDKATKLQPVEDRWIKQKDTLGFLTPEVRCEMWLL